MYAAAAAAAGLRNETKTRLHESADSIQENFPPPLKFRNTLKFADETSGLSFKKLEALLKDDRV